MHNCNNKKTNKKFLSKFFARQCVRGEAVSGISRAERHEVLWKTCKKGVPNGTPFNFSI